MKHRFAAGTLGTLAISLLLAYAPMAQAAQPAAKQPSRPPSARQKQSNNYKCWPTHITMHRPVSSRSMPPKAATTALMTSSVQPSCPPRAKQFALYRQYQKTLRSIARAQLSHQDQINYDILDYELATALSFERFPEYLLPLNQMDSMPVTLANYAGGEASQPLTTVKEYDAYLSRIGQLPGWIDQAIANMKVGMQRASCCRRR